MKITRTVKSLRKEIDESPVSTLGFVPTMGALHEGHLSLVRESVKKCNLTVVSIFVNPTQFNDKEDLKNYPRTEEKDLQLLSTVMGNNDIVFIPAVEEIYPAEDKRVFNFGQLESVMEGQHRPGHFNGVAQVVSRLFEIVRPGIAFFGQKDFQQLTIIKELVRRTGSKIKIEGCPIVREADGLAMSSRNQLLEPAIRKDAPVIYSTISAITGLIRDKEIGDLRKFVFENIEKKQDFKVEYFEIADDAELKTVNSVKELVHGKKYYACIAVRAGKIRLIDNIEISLP